MTTNELVGYNHDTGSIEDFKLEDVSHVSIKIIKGQKVPVYTTTNGARYSQVATFQDLAEYYSAEKGFLQADRDLMINLEQVKYVDEANGMVIFKDGEQLNVARSKIKEITERLNNN
ncbi:hypothetical protein GRF59_14945 [Paenibacillus sp. HJL G12]|uniref:HTH LytTR-type domain-containing protein n=1 Tax=Paenibacillus dendrobii TaxID=2691084 RepID=A0A7X3LH96_9BACL|nr:LytTR family transcriptional regulator DNA-binding domain-containing protein [Paenibacillus dendrobii]MWV44917.1 hypothetical protein [Paenibacillus dendrobii]